MANLIYDKAQIETAIDSIVKRTMRMDLTWDWPGGVAYYGVCEAYLVTGKKEYIEMLKDRVDEYIELGKKAGFRRIRIKKLGSNYGLLIIYMK